MQEAYGGGWVFIPSKGQSKGTKARHSQEPGPFKLTRPEGKEAVPLEKVNVLPRPGKKPEGCVLQMWVSVTDLDRPILTVWNRRAEVAMISH